MSRSIRVRRSVTLAVALAGAVAGSGPARASVSFFSDRAIEDVVRRLVLPPEEVEVEVPPTLEGRVEELSAVRQAGEAAHRIVQELEPTVGARLPAFLRELEALDAVTLTMAERKAISAQGISVLDPGRRQVFEARSAGFAEFASLARRYFEAYDTWMQSEIRSRILGLGLEAIEKRAQLREHGGKSGRKADEAFRELLETELVFRRFSAHPKAKNHHRSLASIVAMRKGAKVVARMDVLLGKAGLGPKRTWAEKFRTLGGQVAESVRAVGAGIAATPALVRALGYLYNPMRKERSPETVSKVLRSLSRNYQWATGMDLVVSGREKIPQDHPVIFAFSHRSELEDALVMMGATPDTYAFMVGQWALPGFLSAKLAAEPSIINVYGKKADGTPVDGVGESIANLEEGRNLVIFPEGMTPTDMGETQPLRHGILQIADGVGDKPVSIVPVTLNDPANTIDGPRNASLGGKLRVEVGFARPLDPVRIRAVPGVDGQLVLDVIRAIWHQELRRPDPAKPVATGAGAGAAGPEVLSVPASQGSRFRSLFAGE